MRTQNPNRKFGGVMRYRASGVILVVGVKDRCAAELC